MAASDRTTNRPPCTSSEGRPIACTRATPARHTVATARSVASRRLSTAATRSRNDLPGEHHRVVLVGEVVAVRDVAADERPEAARDHDLPARVETGHVLLGRVVRVACVRGRLAVSRYHPVLLHMEMQRVLPAAAAVADPPEVRGAP